MPVKEKITENKLTVEQYVNQGGVRCPVCGSDDISGSSIEVDEGVVTQEIGCGECGRC